MVSNFNPSSTLSSKSSLQQIWLNDKEKGVESIYNNLEGFYNLKIQNLRNQHQDLLQKLEFWNKMRDSLNEKFPLEEPERKTEEDHPAFLVNYQSPKKTKIPFKRQRSRQDFYSKTSKKRHIDSYAWQLKVQNKPLHKAVPTSRKILTSKDFKIARDELRYLRTLQKIETLKNEKRWSFRQIRTQKAPPRTKAHWDYLLDEMKWLSTDFREERKWKVTFARQVSLWVMEWHLASDKSEVCVKCKPIVQMEHSSEPGKSRSSSPPPDLSGFAISSKAELNSETNHINEVDLAVSTNEMTELDDSEPTPSCDPNSLKIQLSPSILETILSLDEFKPTLEVPPVEVDAGDISEFNIYAPPSSQNEVYENLLEMNRLVPLSHLMQSKFIPAKSFSETVDEAASEPFRPDEPLRLLPGNSKYDRSLPPSFFPTRKQKDSLALFNDSSDSQIVPQLTWLPEQDDLLKKYIDTFNGNWHLISDALNSSKAFSFYEKTTPKACYERWKSKQEIDTLNPSSSSSSVPSTPKNKSIKVPTCLEDLETQKHTFVMDAIKRVNRKKEIAARAAGQNKKSSAAIDTPSSQSSTKTLSPIELGRLKLERDHQVLKLMHEQRQASIHFTLQNHSRYLQAIPGRPIPSSPGSQRTLSSPVSQSSTPIGIPPGQNKLLGSPRAVMSNLHSPAVIQRLLAARNSSSAALLKSPTFLPSPGDAQARFFSSSEGESHK